MTPFELLAEPLTAEEIEWKVTSSKGGITVLVPYITARAVMERLDRAFGPAGWKVKFRPARIGGQEGVIARLAIKDPQTGEWLEKEDGAEPTDREPFKGAISGALKRVAVQWGIGRELYSYPTVRIIGEYKYIPRPVLERLKGLPQAVAEGKPLPEVITLNPDGTTYKREEA